MVKVISKLSLLIIFTHRCKVKQKVEFEDRKDVIYSVPCKKCGVRYVGKTG